jgi:hypothetical protein
MADDSLDQRKNLISLVKERIKKKFGKDYLKLVEIILDCFVDESITFFEEGGYKTDKEHIVKKLKPVILNLKAEKAKKYVGTIKWLGEIRKKINKAIHGDAPNHHINEDIPFYIKNQKSNKKNFFVTIFFDLDRIKEAREYDEGRIGIDKKSVVIRDCISAHHKTIFGTRELEWMTGYVAKDIKRGIEIDKIKVIFEDGEQAANKEITDSQKKRFDAWSSKESFEYPYPGPTFGLNKFVWNDLNHGDDISFHLRKTDFFTFLEVQKYLTKEQKRSEKMFNACKPSPEISHSISPTAILIVEDGKNLYTVFAQRSPLSSVHPGFQLIGLPICPSPRRKPEGKLMELLQKKNARQEILKGDNENYEKILDGKYFVNILKRGGREELGIELSDDNIKILAFGLDTKRYLFNIIAVARIKMRISDLKAKKHFTFSGNRQYVDLPHKPFNPKLICELLSKISPENRCPTTHAAAYYACCHSFGLGVTYEAFKNLK